MSYTFRNFYIPDRMMGGLKRYIEDGTEPGGFLTAVLENDLERAVSNADEENMANLPAYVAYLYNEAPMGCWGSRKRVIAHMNRKANEREDTNA